MKQIVVLLAALMMSLCAQAQDDLDPNAIPIVDSFPYQKYPAIPTFEMLMTDSSTKFSTYNIPTGKPVIMMFFSPDCDHCEKMTQLMIDNMDVLKNARIYMFSPLSLPALQGFIDKLELNKYKNVKAGKDFEFFFPRFYGLTTVPFIAVYDKNKKLVQAFPANDKIEPILDAVKRGM